jgi:hypothetical protein
MGSGLAYLFSIVCAMYVIFWYRRNEGNGAAGRSGWIAFKDETKKPKVRRQLGDDNR